MTFEFTDGKLKELYETDSGPYKTKFPTQVIDQFFIVMSIIAAAVDERNLRARKGRRFEKLSGNLNGFYSMRLDIQFRLTFALIDGHVIINKIEDYHK